MKKIILGALLFSILGSMALPMRTNAFGPGQSACGIPNAIELSVYIPGITASKTIQEGGSLVGAFTSPVFRNCYYLVKPGTTAEVGELTDYIAGIYYFAVSIGGFVAFFMIMIAGARWILAAGSPDKITKAKEQIFNAIIGLVLLLLSFTILNTINPQLTNLTRVNPTEVTPNVDAMIGNLRNEVKQMEELYGVVCPGAGLAAWNDTLDTAYNAAALFTVFPPVVALPATVIFAFKNAYTRLSGQEARDRAAAARSLAAQADRISRNFENLFLQLFSNAPGAAGHRLSVALAGINTELANLASNPAILPVDRNRIQQGLEKRRDLIQAVIAERIDLQNKFNAMAGTFGDSLTRAGETGRTAEIRCGLRE